MIGHWLGRYLATNDVEKFEAIRQKYCKNIFQNLFIFEIIFFSST
jgi:hypothetical protein